MPWTREDIPDLSGRLAVVTGDPVRMPLLRPDRAAMAELWDISERETGFVFDVAGMVKGN
jgi:hypothetical protein